jgi:hypothetical protein
MMCSETSPFSPSDNRTPNSELINSLDLLSSRGGEREGYVLLGCETA